jgi:asparagine N-glycosylation enzyme membrane subunit Stt3
LPLLAIFLLHSWDRWGWMAIVRTSGAVMQPSVETLGWALPVLATAGMIAAFADARARLTIILLFVIALQALTLFIVAKAQGADTPYMALKMVYLAVYPMAVLGALGVARLAARLRIADHLAWVFAAVLLLAARPAFVAPRPVPVVDLDLYAAAQSLRAQGITSCVDYLVSDAETAYWLHLAVLGNPRASERMQEIDRYDPRAAIAPWITAEGRTFAIADLRLLPDEIRSRVNITAQFGHAGVITGRGATMKGCD